MKLTHILMILALGLAISAAPCRAACTNATFNGPYGFVLNGVDGSTLIAVVGQMIGDGAGGITGTETVSVGGTISSDVSLTGTYSISSNCTGNVTISASGFPTAHFKVTVVSSGTQVDMVEYDTGTNVFGYGLARGNATCTLAATKGTFGFEGGGFNSPTLPNAFEGEVTFNGAGKLSGTESGSSGGTVVTKSISGTYSVNSDCTGSETILFGTNTNTANFVIVNGGSTALVIKTNSGTAITAIVNKR